MLASIKTLSRIRFTTRLLYNNFSSSIQHQAQHIADSESKNPDQESIKTVNTYSLITPELHEAVRNNISSVVSFRADVNHIAWTKICYVPNEKSREKYYIDDWYCNLIDVDRPTISTILRILDKYMKSIPEADVYVIENLTNLRSIPGSEKMYQNLLTAQFFAMFCVLISARKGIPIYDQESGEEIDYHNMYYLKHNLTSRFYKYLIGDEQVSTEKIVESIFEYNAPYRTVHDEPKLSSIDVPTRHIQYFKKSRPVTKEYLGNSMLVGLTFLKLFVEQCPECIHTLKLEKTPKEILEK